MFEILIAPRHDKISAFYVLPQFVCSMTIRLICDKLPLGDFSAIAVSVRLCR